MSSLPSKRKSILKRHPLPPTTHKKNNNKRFKQNGTVSINEENNECRTFVKHQNTASLQPPQPPQPPQPAQPAQPASTTHSYKNNKRKSSNRKDKNWKNDDQGGYDSDDLYDGLASSGGEHFHLESITKKGHKHKHRYDDENDEDNETMRERKRLIEKRDRMKNQDDASALDDFHKTHKSAGEYFKGEEPNVSSTEFSLLNETNQNEYDAIPIEPFHMTQEREGGAGYFDGDTYVFRKAAADDNNQDMDAWIDSLDDEKDPPNTIHPFSYLPKKNIKNVPEKPARTKYELFLKLYELLNHPEETIQMAIKRYGREKKNIHQKIKNHGKDEHSMALLSSINSALNLVIEYANHLLMMDDGHNDVYEFTKRRIYTILPSMKSKLSTNMNQNGFDSITTNVKETSNVYFQSEYTSQNKTNTQNTTNTTNTTPQSSSSLSSNIITDTDQWEWEYRGNEDGKIHGPYSTKHMLAWIQAGYFLNDNAVDVRKRKKLDTNHGKGSNDVDDLIDDLLEDDEEVQQEEEKWFKSDEIDFSAHL